MTTYANPANKIDKMALLIKLRHAADLIDRAKSNLESQAEYEGRFLGDRARQRGETRPGDAMLFSQLNSMATELGQQRAALWIAINQIARNTNKPYLAWIRPVVNELVSQGTMARIILQKKGRQFPSLEIAYQTILAAYRTLNGIVSAGYV